MTRIVNLPVIMLLFCISIDATASSLRGSKLIYDFLNGRVKKVAEAIRSDIISFDDELISASKKTMPRWSYVPGVSSELFTYVKNLTVKKGMFWRLRDPAGNVHHLLGTRHSFTIQDFDAVVFDELQQMIDSSELVLGEASSNPLIRKAISSNRSMLDDQLPDLLEKSLIDNQITLLALQRGKMVSSLETTKELADIFRSHGVRLDDGIEFSDDFGEQVRIAEHDLLKSVDTTPPNPNPIEAITQDLVDDNYLRLWYTQANTQDLLNYWQDMRRQAMVNARTTVDIVESMTLGARNKLWVERITSSCSKGDTCFIYVGYGHMLFDNSNTRSLISLLEERGYKAEAMF